MIIKDLKAGDTVEVTNTGCHYSSYKSMFLKMNFNNPDEYRGMSLKKGMTGTVIGIENHSDPDQGRCIGIRTKDNDFLIGEGGIVKIKSMEKKNRINLEI